jgi:DNA invertase Pin-like site-specific DNA recombinase
MTSEPTMRKLGYLRVSKQEQRPDRQIDGLETMCDALYVERLSAVSTYRPVYERVLTDLSPGDTLVIWDLDRAFRSVVDAVLELEKLRARAVSLQIVNLQVDTATPGGMLVYTVMSAFAEFERNMLSRRTREGLAAAKRRGKKLGRGRPSCLPPSYRPPADALRRETLPPPHSPAAMASHHGPSPGPCGALPQSDLTDPGKRNTKLFLRYASFLQYIN